MQNKILIPVSTFPTWYEFKIWKGNPKIRKEIKWDYVKEPELFGLIEQIFPKANFQTYEAFTTNQILSDLSRTLEEVARSRSFGAISHLALSGISTDELVTPPPIETLHFSDGEVLTAEKLNQLYELVVRKSERFGEHISRKYIWVNGTTVSAEELNKLINDLNILYQKVRGSSPQWSFTKFKNGTVLKAQYLNEIVLRTFELEKPLS